MIPIRVYTPKGREVMISRPGQIVPAGYLSGSAPFAPFATDMVAVIHQSDGNPYEERSSAIRTLVLQPKKP